ncbi:MAG TPA: molybdenum cofactor guanylyltransferase [Permianibacter sp.]|nr:molybdenum cofactor guanylyltransferase [Permianibacter sp.]
MALPVTLPPSRPTAGLVLAGGQSRRMGRNKALLPVTAQQTLLQYMLQQLQVAGCAPVLVSGDAVGGLADRLPEAGPLAGIDSALHALAEHAEIEQVLVVPVDMPALPPALLSQLIAAGDGRCAVQLVGDSPLPLLLPSTAAVRAVVAKELQPGARRSLRDVLAKLPLRTVALPTDATTVLANLNTPSDWLLWQQQDRGDFS